MARWSMQQVERAAPDDKSVVAARRLARPGPWSETGSTDVLVWGKCQGSGSTAYQVSVDLTGPAFKCSCPSRKFPCKHGLALLMLWVRGDGEVADVAEPPGFAGDWKADREHRGSGRRTRPKQDPVDPEAQAKRLDQRLALMSSGCEEFELWLRDLVRNGMAAARERGYEYWDAAAGRLVDAQLPGLAERVRDMGGVIHSNDRWADVLLSELGRWYLAVTTWPRRDDLEAADLANLRAYLGWAVPTEDVLGSEPIDDEWTVLGVLRTESGRLQQQRTWLYGTRSNSTVLILDFAAVGGVLRVAQVIGAVVDTPVVRYPGSGVRRTLFAADPVPTGRSGALPDGGDGETALRRLADQLSENPFTARVPVVLDAATVAVRGGVGRMITSDGREFALGDGVDLDRLLALTGGLPNRLFGELEDDCFRPLTVQTDEGLVGV